MTTYLSDPITVDRASIRAQIDAKALELRPDLDVTSPFTEYDFLANIHASMHAEILQTLTQMLAIAFRGSLGKVDRIFQRDAIQATATGTLARTAADAVIGTRIIPAGTEFNLQGADGQPVAVQTINDTTFTGSDASESVDLIAVNGGTGGNGLATVIGPAQTVSWYLSLVLDAPASGGEDAEDDDTYLDRGADEKPGRAFTIVRPDDFARWLRTQPGVDRALVVNNYNADTSTADVGGHMTGIPIDIDGAALSSGAMTALEAAAQEITVTDGEIHVVGPTDTLIEVVFEGTAEVGFDETDVEARAEQAVLNFLDRSAWGEPDHGDQQDWLDERIVRYQDVITVLNNVQGFDRINEVSPGVLELTINGARLDVSMPGPGALPDADSTVDGTVEAA